MGLRNRLRIERIKQGLEVPRSLRRLQDKVTRDEKADEVRLKNKAIITTKCPDITNLTEIKTCNQIMRFLGMPKVPKHIVAEKLKEGMRIAIAKLLKAGETKDSILKFYWDIPEFQELWTKLGYNKDDWYKMAMG